VFAPNILCPRRKQDVGSDGLPRYPNQRKQGESGDPNLRLHHTPLLLPICVGTLSGMRLAECVQLALRERCFARMRAADHARAEQGQAAARGCSPRSRGRPGERWTGGTVAYRVEAG